MVFRSRILRAGRSRSSGRVSEASAVGRGGDGEGLEVEFFVELADAGLQRGIEQLVGHSHQDAVVAGGVLGEDGDELVGHDDGVAGLSEGVAQALGEFGV